MPKHMQSIELRSFKEEMVTDAQDGDLTGEPCGDMLVCSWHSKDEWLWPIW